MNARIVDSISMDVIPAPCDSTARAKGDASASVGARGF
jgi:hypothetical protein